jgi:type IV pilus assembly protein PilX
MLNQSRLFNIATIQEQQGAVLVISLVILLILTLIGITSLRSTTLEQRIAGNIRDISIALQSSESGLRDAEMFLESLTSTSAFGSTPGLYQLGNAPSPLDAATWTGTASIQGTVLNTSLPITLDAPRYFIELRSSVSAGGSINITSYGAAEESSVSLFRIVSQGRGPSGVSKVLLEVFYGKAF